LATELPMSKRVLMSWSSGKDSAWALHTLRQQPDVEVRGLLTTFNQAADRVAMHAVRSELVRAQAAAAQLPLWEIPLPWPCSNEEYEARMAAAVSRACAEGFTHVAFGDLFLEDVRRYREERLAGTGLEPLFPVWGLPTDSLAREMVAGGVRAVLTCVDPRCLPHTFAGRDFDESLLRDLPAGIDPCGERGEFHTFVWDGPMFATGVPIERGVTIERDGFVFNDLLLRESRVAVR
jgi:uncharacterized protein (TIGR00290 family)